MMSTSGTLSFSLLIFLLLAAARTTAATVFSSDDEFNRDDFPLSPEFVFGSGTSAYQVEGEANGDGRTPSIWDTFAHAGKVHGDTGDRGCDQYHKYKEDVHLMVETGLEAYRFSISWSRLIPNGKGPVNPKGVEYYNNLVNELISHGYIQIFITTDEANTVCLTFRQSFSLYKRIQPHVTLHHSDLPQALEDEYGGWLSRKIVKDFTAYADVCFREFGDRISHWITLNEANAFVWLGYDWGLLPPERCSSPYGLNCSKGNSSTEPYMAAHHMLLAHASAARLYKKKYQGKQQGYIGLNVLAFYVVPITNSTEDAIATQRAYDFFIGWFVNPLVFGDYPDIMKKIVGSRLPTFTSHESKLVKGAFDFFGMNHYNNIYIKDKPSNLKNDHRDYTADMAVELMFTQPGSPIHELTFTPWGMQGVLEYFKQAYGNPPIYIHENGLSTLHNSSLTDTPRVEYMQGYIGSLLNAVRNGSNTRGYFTWSFLDVFEIFDGWKSGYGLYYVDLDDPDLRRYPRLSAHWYSNFLKGGRNSRNEVLEIKTSTSSKFDRHLSQ